MKIKSVVYGLGGYDETKPDNNIVEILYYTAEEEAQAQAAAEAAEAKAALLAKLGITEEEAQLLLGGN
jgi:hypothetical protein